MELREVDIRLVVEKWQDQEDFKGCNTLEEKIEVIKEVDQYNHFKYLADGTTLNCN